MRIERMALRQVGPFEEVVLEFPKGKDPSHADVYLLTGPNGSGKSTALYAIASTLAAPNWQVLGTDLLASRLRSGKSFAVVRTDRGVRGRAWPRVEGAEPASIPNPFYAGGILPRVHQGTFGDHSDDPSKYSSRAQSCDPRQPRGSWPVFDWAAFAYAGMRSVEHVQITAIREPAENPFANSLSFVQTADSGRLANWIAGQEFKGLRAKEAGNSARAELYRQSIVDIAGVVSDIIGERFAFVMAEDDLNVRARIADRVIELGLLPDGLKSIVSWVADLLMRLDRIPWAGDIPAMKRNFLLLLDEVDIHLHPSWQRKVLPIVQRVFPNAQIIASTHSPFVVASAADATIITLAVGDGVASVEKTLPSQTGVSYSAVLRSIFGIDKEFDIGTEREFERFHDAKGRLLAGDVAARPEVDALARSLAARSEEVRELVGIELRQMERLVARRGT